MTPDRGEIGREPSAAEKVAAVAGLLGGAGAVEIRETSMAWVFLTATHAYKMKKSIRRNSIDFSRLELRHRACAEEVRLNRRLAPDVYLGLARLTRGHEETLALDGAGTTVEWLVRMRRLSDARFLDRLIAEGAATLAGIEAVADCLARFHQAQPPQRPAPGAYLDRYRETIEETRRLLGAAPFVAAAPRFRRLTDLLVRILVAEPGLLLHRLDIGRIVEGHGDLRPEHVWLGPPIRVIDCLELAPIYRHLDPFEEYATLAMECAVLGSGWVGTRLRAAACGRLDDDIPDRLWAFYTAHRATFRARQALAHLVAPCPRTPEKWGPQAQRYLDAAERAAATLETPAVPPASRRNAGG